jgi:hypothetical protein
MDVWELSFEDGRRMERKVDRVQWRIFYISGVQISACNTAVLFSSLLSYS